MTYSFLQNQAQHLITNYLNKHLTNNRKITIIQKHNSYEINYNIILTISNNQNIILDSNCLEELSQTTLISNHDYPNIINKLLIPIFKLYGLTIKEYESNGSYNDSLNFTKYIRYNYEMMISSTFIFKISFIKHRCQSIFYCYIFFNGARNIQYPLLSLLMDPLLLVNEICKKYNDYPNELLLIDKQINKTTSNLIEKYWLFKKLFLSDLINLIMQLYFNTVHN